MKSEVKERYLTLGYQKGYLILLSPKAKIGEIVKAKSVLKHLVKLCHFIIIVKTNTYYKDLVAYLLKMNYTNYRLIDNNNLSIVQIMEYLYNNSNTFEVIIVIGLTNNDFLSKYLDEYIGYNYEVYIIALPYDYNSDATRLINDGALLLGSSCELH